MAYFGRNWLCMLAGDLFSYPGIRRHVKAFCETNGITGEFDSEQIADAFKYAFEREPRRRAESDILLPYGLTFENYRDEGPKLGTDTYSRIIFDLQNKELAERQLPINGILGNWPDGRSSPPRPTVL